MSISDKPEVAVEALKNLVKNLMRTKDEVIFFIYKKTHSKKLIFDVFIEIFKFDVGISKKFIVFIIFRLSKTFLLEFPLFPLPAMLVMDRKYP